MLIPVVEPFALFLDFDGTLVDIAPTPEKVEVSGELRSLLERLYNRLGGALAVVTGRSLESLDHFLEMPHLPAAGSHGAQWRFAGGTLHSVDGPSESLREAIARVKEFANRHQLLAEDKHYSVALHFRQNPEMEARIDDWLADTLSGTAGLRLVHGKCLREIKDEGVDKGKAVERFMQEKGGFGGVFGGRQPVYLGDDITDEDAFVWVNGHSGISVKVGPGETSAGYRLDSRKDVIKFLQSLVGNY